VEIMNQRDFSISYFALAKRYHPDRNPQGAELMAHIPIEQLIAKPRKPNPSDPMWPDGSPYREPRQLLLPFTGEPDNEA